VPASKIDNVIFPNRNAREVMKRRRIAWFFSRESGFALQLGCKTRKRFWRCSIHLSTD
jgi:hypothetical protein